MNRVQELCRKLGPVLGKRVDGLWSAYVAEDSEGKADIEQTLELLAAKHLGQNYEPDRSPYPPPPEKFSTSGDIPLGRVAYGNRLLYPFHLRSTRLKEHLLVAGRSGSGKTNLTFVLLDGIITRSVNVLAIDWKRGYRDLIQKHPQLRVYTVGRNISPLRFNPLIPPPGCEPHVWIKLTVDVIASSYLGGEGVISLLVAGLDHLFTEYGVFSGNSFNHLTLVRHLKRPPSRRMLNPLHRQPNRLSNRGVEVRDAHRVVLNVSAPPVRLPVRLPTLDPSLGQQARECAVVVVEESAWACRDGLGVRD